MVVASQPVTAVVVSVCGELLFCVHAYLYGSLQHIRIYVYNIINTFIIPDFSSLLIVYRPYTGDQLLSLSIHI